jgi:hypothetical protein
VIIKGVSNNGKFFPLSEQKKNKEVQNDQEKKVDKLEISSEARNLQQVSAKDLSAIKSNIDQKFYDSDVVINATVEAIMKEFGIE